MATPSFATFLIGEARISGINAAIISGTRNQALKSQLRYRMRQLDPFELKSDIARAQTQLLELVRKKNMSILYPGPAYPEAAELKSRVLFG